MRISRVIGKLTLNRKLKEIVPGSFLIVQPLDRRALKQRAAGTAEPLVLYDCLAAREGDLVGMVEGREAAVAFGAVRVPYDAYNACILDDYDFQPILPA